MPETIKQILGSPCSWACVAGGGLGLEGAGPESQLTTEKLRLGPSYIAEASAISQMEPSLQGEVPRGVPFTASFWEVWGPESGHRKWV